MTTRDLELYTDGILAERERISELLEDIITELQLEFEQATKEADMGFANTLADRIAVLQELESIVKAEA